MASKGLTLEEIKARCEKVGLIYVSHKYVDNGNKRGTIVTAKCECGEILTIDVSTLKRYVEQGKEYHCKDCATKIRQEKRMQDNTDKFKKQCKKVGLTYISHFVKNSKYYVIAKCQCGKDIKIGGVDLGQYAKNNKTYSCKKCAQAKRGLESRISVEEIVKRCEAVNLKYISHDYINTGEEHMQTVVNVQCQCGEIINNVRLSNITEKMKKNEIYICKKCANKKMSEFHIGLHPSEETRKKISENRKGKTCGENHPNWKGGLRDIKIHLRNLPSVQQWRKNVYDRENNRCQLTGKKVHGGNSDVHHLYGFNMIVLDAHEKQNIKVRPTVGEYSQDELKNIESYVNKWHENTSNGILLCEEVHKLFHSLYGSGDNTPEQFEEFKERYLNGEFDSNAEVA